MTAGQPTLPLDPRHCRQSARTHRRRRAGDAARPNDPLSRELAAPIHIKLENLHPARSSCAAPAKIDTPLPPWPAPERGDRASAR